MRSPSRATSSRSYSALSVLGFLAVGVTVGCGDDPTTQYNWQDDPDASSSASTPPENQDSGSVTAPAKSSAASSHGGRAAPPAIGGAWIQTCDDLNVACDGYQWQLRLGASVLDGPGTAYSYYGPCYFPNTPYGHFTQTASTITLAPCYDADGGELTFEYQLRDQDHLALTDSSGVVYEMERDFTSSPTLLQERVIDLDGAAWCDYPTEIFTHSASNYWYYDYAFAGVQVVQGGSIYEDRFQWNLETYYSQNNTRWTGFDGYNDRGALSGSYPANEDTPMGVYRVTYAEDMTPLYAVGYENEDCQEGTAKVYEHDLRAGKTFRRFWSWADAGLNQPITIDVPADFAGPVQEIAVTIAAENFSNIGKTKFTLTSPSGIEIVLTEGSTGYYGNVNQYYYANFQDANAPWTLSSEWPSTYTGMFRSTYQPTELLSKVNGVPANGTWTLTATETDEETEEDYANVYYFGLSIR